MKDEREIDERDFEENTDITTEVFPRIHGVKEEVVEEEIEDAFC